MKWTKEDIKYIVGHYKKWGDAIKLAGKFKVKRFVIQDIISRLRKAGVKIPYIDRVAGGKHEAIQGFLKDKK